MKPPNITMIAHRDLHPLEFNRPDRSGFDAASLKQLADSIASQGIVQPLVVRKRDKGRAGYDIICGERRWTAAGLAKRTELPCVIREATDAEARELNLIENIQRVGVHEMEEARGYSELLALRDDKQQPLHTIPSLAAKIGKSEAYIYGRLKLLRMPDLAQACFIAGKMSASVALLICRIPDPKLAYKATLEVMDRSGRGGGAGGDERALNDDVEPMSYRMAKEHIQLHYMKRLKGVKWDPEDKDLLPVEYRKATEEELKSKTPVGPLDRIAGGACKDCPFRTGNMKALFKDVDSADVCTNTPCFQRKEKAHFAKEAKRFEAKGQTLLPEKKASALLNYDGTGLSINHADKFLDLRAKVPGKKNLTYQQALEEHLPEDADVFIARGKQVVPLVSMDVAVEAAKKAGVKLEKPESHAHDPAAQQKAAAEREARRELHTLAAEKAHAELLAVVAKRKPLEILRFAAGYLIEFGRGEAMERNGWSDIDAARKGIAKLDLEALATLLLDVTIGDRLDWQGEFDPQFLDVLKEFDVDLKKITSTAKAELEKAAKAEATKADAAKPETKLPPKTKE